MLEQFSRRVTQSLEFLVPLIEREDFLIIHWINHLQFFDPQQSFRGKLWTSTYLSFESHLPTSKCCWCRELVKMKIRNLQSLLVCHIILWKSSLVRVEWISGWRSWLASRIQSCVWVLTFTRNMRWCVFRYVRNPRIDNVMKKTPVDLQKRFPIYHACLKYLAAARCGSAFPENGLASLQDHDGVEVTLVDW